MGNSEKTIIINVRTLFSFNNYVATREEEILIRNYGMDDPLSLENVYKAFPEVYRDIDISPDYFNLVRIIHALQVSKYSVELIMVMSDEHPNRGLAITQYHERLRHFLGNKLFKKLNLITLDTPMTAQSRLSGKDYYIDTNVSSIGSEFESLGGNYVKLSSVPKLLELLEVKVATIS